jgi:hypothetical protein
VCIYIYIYILIPLFVLSVVMDCIFLNARDSEIFFIMNCIICVLVVWLLL